MKTRRPFKNLAGVAIAVSILGAVTGCIDSAVGSALEQALSLAPQFVERQETPPAEPVPAGAIEIATIDQLQQIGKNAAYPRDGHYVLTQDIDASVTANWNDGKGFDPIGMREREAWDTLFEGVFDGRGHVITALTINRSDEDFVGLFGATGSESVIERVGLRDASVTGQVLVGLLVGFSGGTIRQSYATGKVRGENAVGGLVGSNSIALSDAYAIAYVDGASNSGGLVGTNGGEITRCFAAGVVAEREVNNSPLVGDTPSSGDGTGSMSKSFYDVKAGVECLDPWCSCTGLSTAVMQTRRVFVEAGWDFDKVWAIDEGTSYPYLRWELRRRRIGKTLTTRAMLSHSKPSLRTM